MDKNYQFFMKADLDGYIGQWIAICNQKIISHGNSIKKVFQEAKEKCPNERPLLTRVPDKETMIF
ncbi:succinyl-CoA synthetase subunit alpha [Candidatus Woesearchaeota archaeon]|nr:succinyl-CoA synthetase subunit alpha [Candidatus Woesearchaeota archaeon]